MKSKQVVSSWWTLVRGWNVKRIEEWRPCFSELHVFQDWWCQPGRILDCSAPVGSAFFNFNSSNSSIPAYVKEIKSHQKKLWEHLFLSLIFYGREREANELWTASFAPCQTRLPNSWTWVQQAWTLTLAIMDLDVFLSRKLNASTGLGVNPEGHQGISLEYLQLLEEADGY